MANKWEVNPKLKTARSPGSIANQQHHDKSLSERDIAGSPGTVKKITSDASTEIVVDDFAVIRVMNTTGSMAFVYIGDTPPATVDITNGIAIPANFYENFYVGKLADGKSVKVKASAAGVQIVEFEL